ncbi:hypothetical protein MNV49_005800 [Pseudohyphozyma bogoriensis]|nr:hypothetical protein MNV49_005800 [Pseudohyphozyma bogoriensis]
MIAAPTPVFLEDLPLDQAQHAPMFTMSKERGFLPREDPLAELPAQFAGLESLLRRMTIKQPDGSQGLLALGTFGETVKKELGQEMTDRVMAAIQSKDEALISALFRDYCFLTSAYLLEPVDYSFRKTGVYGTGRNVLPYHVAVPLNALAEHLGHYPYMEYASSYALVNFRRVNSGGCAPGKLGDLKTWETDNLRIIRAFEDHDGSEAGFILVHISMVAYTGMLVTAAEKVLDGAVATDRAAFNAGLKELNDVYTKINEVMDTMWGWSRPIDYLKFRSFIFGTGPKKLNSMFPEGVLYEGVSDEPMSFRGESGANDSIVPLGDNLLQITAHLPKNALADILRDFRKYRPSAQRDYVEGLEHRAVNADIAAFAEKDPESLALYICNVDQIRDIRERHWRFTKEYIIKRTDHPIATGGSPILEYLPQNLTVVLDVLSAACDKLPSSSDLSDKALAHKVEEIRARAVLQKKLLGEEVERLKAQVQGKDDKLREKTSA